MWIFMFTLVLCAFAINAEFVPGNPQIVKTNVQSCLIEVGLDVSALGLTKIEDLTPKILRKYRDFPTEKRNCFVTCIMIKQEYLPPDGKIPEEYLSGPQDSLNACRAKTDPCEVGYCFYEVISR